MVILIWTIWVCASVLVVAATGAVLGVGATCFLKFVQWLDQ